MDILWHPLTYKTAHFRSLGGFHLGFYPTWQLNQRETHMDPTCQDEVAAQERAVQAGSGADVWGPRWSHAKSVATSDKTGVKIAERPSLHWLCKLGDALYSDFAL